MNGSNNDCPICLATVSIGFTTHCGHTFCSTCLTEALIRNPKCPLCRSGNIHMCTTVSDQCTLCLAGHRPGLIAPNLFPDDNAFGNTRYYYMTNCEIAKLMAKVCILFSIQIAASILCIMNIITLLTFCLICFHTTIVNMTIIAQWSPSCFIYRIRQIIRMMNQVSDLPL